MGCKIEYKSSVARDLKKLDKKIAGRILEQIESELEQDPDRGAPLTGKFRGLYRYRIEDYLAVFAKTEECVLILRIAHRGKAYR